MTRDCLELRLLQALTEEKEEALKITRRTKAKAWASTKDYQIKVIEGRWTHICIKEKVCNYLQQSTYLHLQGKVFSPPLIYPCFEALLTVIFSFSFSLFIHYILLLHSHQLIIPFFIHHLHSFSNYHTQHGSIYKLILHDHGLNIKKFQLSQINLCSKILHYMFSTWYILVFLFLELRILFCNNLYLQYMY